MRQMKNSKNTQDSLLRENLINRLTTRIRESLEITEILKNTVVEIRSFLGTDRVKIYRFCGDGTGDVIAESIEQNKLPSLVGLRFPASDIPALARQMFIKARQRVIVDVTSGQKIVENVDKITLGKSSDIRYSQVDPCHIEYLTAMGVKSSLVIPILHQNQLWGLLVSHNCEHKSFTETELQIVQLLVDQVSIAIAQSNLLARAKQQAHHEAIINQISRLLHSPLHIKTIYHRVLEASVKALNTVGGRLYITAELAGKEAQIYTIGKQPKVSNLEETNFWQKIISEEEKEPEQELTLKEWELHLSNMIEEDLIMNKNKTWQIHYIDDIYREEKLQENLGMFEGTNIRSILIIPLQYYQQCVGCITLFRNEIETETLWAGKQNEDERNIRPRQSFAQWKEIKKGEAQKWLPEEISLAEGIATHLYMAIMQRRIDNMIRHEVYHDKLTGLPNRLLFSDRLSLVLANAHQFGEMLAVVFLDLDGFKNINDTLGHAVGDELLINVADRLKKCLRSTDMIARWGGDEFTLLLSPIHSNKDAMNVCEEILTIFTEPFEFNDPHLYIKGSMGIAIAPYDGEDSETLLKNADAAMYKAKQKGRNNYQLYNAAIGNKALERMTLENNLHKALDREEFVLHYQPQNDIKTGRIVGLETLIRWQKSGQLISPMQFIALAEESSLICDIGEWVLKKACQQNKIWQDLGLPPVCVAVNISARQLQQRNFIKTIENILQETNLEPQYLEIEITESVAMQNITYTSAMLNVLRSLGISVSMDDFGTGYSSLNSLKNLPLDRLKIDKSFINDLKEQREYAIIKAIVELGHGLNLTLVAEGVETQEQLQILRSINCDIMQGFLFSRPVDSQFIPQLFAKEFNIN